LEANGLNMLLYT